jgi:hypothetical protein
MLTSNRKKAASLSIVNENWNEGVIWYPTNDVLLLVRIISKANDKIATVPMAVQTSDVCLRNLFFLSLEPINRINVERKKATKPRGKRISSMPKTRSSKYDCGF